MEVAIRRSVQWLPVAGRWTRISIMGTNFDEQFHFATKTASMEHDSDTRTTAILLIPGNPGNEGFYEHFGRELLKNLESEKQRCEAAKNDNYILYTVSHLNHVPLPNELHHQNSGQKESDRFDLNDQIEHKLAFCKEYLAKSHRIVMLGHSIGSYIMLKILPDLLCYEYNVVCAGALFPTIERMAQSPNGERLFPIVSKLNCYDTLLTKPLVFWLDYLPMAIRKWLCSWVLPSKNVPECVFWSAAELLRSNVFRNVVHMCTDELHKVKELELNATLLKYSDRIRFYYGTSDAWCPLEFGHEMRKRLGDELVSIDDSDCKHAFVISDNEVMARKVVDWIIA